MKDSNTTFGRMFDARERSSVYAYLSGTKQYRKFMEALETTRMFYLWLKDDQWEIRKTTLFHCEAHLDLNSQATPWGSWWN
jgi:hypothetical protein